MGLFFFGFLMGILFSVIALLVRCALWFEEAHPEDDYWHRRSGRRRTVNTTVIRQGSLCDMEEAPTPENAALWVQEDEVAQAL